MVAIGTEQLNLLNALKYHRTNMTLCIYLDKDWESYDLSGKQLYRSKVNSCLRSLVVKGLVKHEDGKWVITNKGTFVMNLPSIS